MKKRIISIVLLVAIISSMFAGCTFEDFEKKIVKDDGEIDPATVMVADLLKKTISNNSLIVEDTEYILYDDNTASVKKYNGDSADIVIPSTIENDGTEYTVVGIDNKAFYKNTTIESLTISDTVQVVGNFAFMSCKNLKNIVIGENVGYIGVSAFQADKAPQNDKEKRLDENGKEMLNRKGDPIYYDGIGHLEHVEWLGAPKVIEEKAFYLNDKLDEIVLPVGVEEIGDWAFAKCSGASRIILPEGLKSIGEYSFIKNVSAKEIVIPGTCEVIKQSAFYRNSNVQTITIGEGVKELCQGAFEECESVKEIVVPSTVTSVGKYAFYHCYDLEVANISKDTQIDKKAFRENKTAEIKEY